MSPETSGSSSSPSPSPPRHRLPLAADGSLVGSLCRYTVYANATTDDRPDMSRFPPFHAARSCPLHLQFLLSSRRLRPVSIAITLVSAPRQQTGLRNSKDTRFIYFLVIFFSANTLGVFIFRCVYVREGRKNIVAYPLSLSSRSSFW